jgi:EAL domain-containing protein (putative c-di-GMP-specific phosphodiesterase class I)/GGDEF domain-containing protein
VTTRSTLTELADTLRAAGVGVFVYEGAERRQRWLAGAEHFAAPDVDGLASPGEPAGGHVETRLLRLDHDPDGAPRFLGLMHPIDGGAPSVARISGRSALQAHLTQLAETLKPQALVACCVFGIDGMREFSRCYGFEAGDALACAVGERLSRMLPAGAAVSRIGGAKFAAAVIGDDAAAVRARATAIAAEFAALSFDVGFGSISVTLSIGAAVARAPALGTPEPFEAALAALDEAAGEHDGGVFVADGAVDAADMTPAAMRAGARAVMRALESDSVAIAFQPVVTAQPPYAVSFRECLARLRDPAGKWVAAGQFLPKIERLDLVSTLDRRILRLAVETLGKHPTERLSVNVSTRTMRDRAWLRDLRAAAEEHPGAVERLIVELTESSAVTDAERTRRFLDSVRALGCAIALDDFGAGYSSFRHVRDFRPDWVKIDGGFVRGVATDPDNMLFVDTLVGIARNFEMATVAEFVENDADAATLLSLGVDCLQGYRFGAPEMDPVWSDPQLKLVR